jgi:hypothetical protein
MLARRLLSMTIIIAATAPGCGGGRPNPNVPGSIRSSDTDDGTVFSDPILKLSGGDDQRIVAGAPIKYEIILGSRGKKQLPTTVLVEIKQGNRVNDSGFANQGTWTAEREYTFEGTIQSPKSAGTYQLHAQVLDNVASAYEKGAAPTIKTTSSSSNDVELEVVK